MTCVSIELYAKGFLTSNVEFTILDLQLSISLVDFQGLECLDN